jgi:hypothetical protein
MQNQRAVSAAWEVYRQPARYRTLRRQDIPTDILDVIKISGGDEATTQIWAEQLGVNAEELGKASSYYLHQFMAAAGNDARRLLCLDQWATAADLKMHKRWLLKWLHPDRNPSAWEANLFRRVNEAASSLERDWERLSAGASSDGQPPALTARTSRRGDARHETRERRKQQPKGPMVRVRQTHWTELRNRVYRRVAKTGALLLLMYAGYAAVLHFVDRERSPFGGAASLLE